MEKEEKKVMKQELSEEELDEVAGGANTSDCAPLFSSPCPSKRMTDGNSCPNYVFG